MAWQRRKSGTNFRSRRFSSRPGMQGGRQRKWVFKSFPNVFASPQFFPDWIDLFELVSPEDYIDDQGLDQIEHATVIRVIARVNVDLVISAPGANGVEYAAALFTRSERSVISEFANDPFGNFAISPSNGGATTNIPRTLSRLQPMWWLPFRAYSGAFRENPGGVCSEFFADVNRPNESDFEIRTRQKRKMKTDDALFLLIAGQSICNSDGLHAVVTVMSRTLILND